MKPDAAVATDYTRAVELAEGLEEVAKRYDAGANLPGSFLARLTAGSLFAGLGGGLGGEVGVTGLAPAVRAMGDSRRHFADATKATAVRVVLAADKTRQADI